MVAYTRKMKADTTLYKIRPDSAPNNNVAVETLQNGDGAKTHLLFCGGFHSSMYGNKANYLLELCRQENWVLTRYDYRGHGLSDGTFEDCNLHDWLADTVAVIDRLEQPLCLIGSSMGAWLAAHATLLRPKKISSLVTIAAAPDFTSELLWPSLTDKQQQQVRNGDTIELPTPYEEENWRLRQGLFVSGQELALLNKPETLPITCPVRMLHGTRDPDVPWQQSQRLLEKLNPSIDAELRLIHGGDHRLSDSASLTILERTLTELLH